MPRTKKTNKDEVEVKKKKKQPSTYALFVKQHYHTPECLDLPVRQRLGWIAKKWHAHKEESKE